MKVSFIQRIDSRRLLLIYAGWSVEADFFNKLRCPGYDIAVAYDYSTLEPPTVGSYDEVIILAWSLGVHAAELTSGSLPLTLTIAVNGTSTPVSNTQGIPEAIYSATAKNLTEQSLAKFRRRMGASGMPHGSRSIDDLKSELINFPRNEVAFRWDRAVISRDDKIFPPENQHNAWRNRAEITFIEGSHTPDFRHIVDSFVINKPLVTTRFAKGQTTYDEEASVQHIIADNLFNLWCTYGLSAKSVLEFGVGTGYLTDKYRQHVKELTLWDISPYNSDVLQADAEVAIRSVCTPFDAIVSSSTIQWFNSPGAFLINCIKAVKSNGLIVLSTFGSETFREMSVAGVIPLPYLNERSLLRIIPVEFDVLVLQSELITMEFDSPLEVLKHLKATGVNARSCKYGVRELIRRYPQRPDGKFELTYQPVYLILRRK